MNTYHPMTSFGDHLGALKSVAEELGIPFECYDHCTPDKIKARSLGFGKIGEGVSKLWKKMKYAD